MANANKNTNIYGSLDLFKAAFAKRFLIRVGNFADEEPADFTSEINDRLTEALRDASDVMDGYLMGRYATPIDPAPDFFEKDCYCIAIGILIRRKGYESDTPDANAVKDADKCIKKYEMISQGKMDISLPDDGTGETAPPVKYKATAPEKIFNDTTLDKY